MSHFVLRAVFVLLVGFGTAAAQQSAPRTAKARIVGQFEAGG
jgi:hypothetical protein